MSQLIAIVRGSTKTLSVGLKVNNTVVTDLTDWTCHIQLRNKKTKVITGSVDREVTTKNTAQDRFLVTLSAQETDLDNFVNYILGIEFRNSVTSQIIEDKDNIIEIEIKDGWVY